MTIFRLQPAGLAGQARDGGRRRPAARARAQHRLHRDHQDGAGARRDGARRRRVRRSGAVTRNPLGRSHARASMLAQARRDDPAVAAGRRHPLRALSAHTRLEPRSLAAPVSARPPRLVSHVRAPPCQRTATVASIIVPSELNRKGGGVASARASASRMLAWGALLGGAPTPLRLPRSCLAAAPCPPPRALTLATPALHAPSPQTFPPALFTTFMHTTWAHSEQPRFCVSLCVP